MDSELGNRRKNRIWVAVAVAVVLFGDILISKLTFYSLCMVDGGQKIHRVAPDVEGLITNEGFGCGGYCKSLLGESKYRYIEVEVSSPRVENLSPVAGKYKFYLATRGAPECANYEATLKENPYYEKSNEKSYKILGSQCIASVRVPEFAGRYEYESRWDYGYIKVLGISRIIETVTDRSTGEVMATSTGFSRLNGWILLLSGLDQGGNDTCHMIDGSIVSKTLKPR